MNKRLVLFFTRGVSVQTWADVGMLDREVAVYHQLRMMGIEASFLTYGTARDRDHSEATDGIRILCNDEALPEERYEENLLNVHADALDGCDVIKTNQSFGAEIAMSAARRFGKPLVARCGYMWSLNAQREFGAGSPQHLHALETEAQTFSAAERVIVTTEAMYEDLRCRLPHVSDKTVIIPNYVDTHRFNDRHMPRDSHSVVYVGRIAAEKNLRSLLHAVERLPVGLTVIGNGPMRSTLESEFSHLGRRVRWLGNVPNRQLPDYLNRSGIFVLPSLYEGHPKSLIEAMACGAAVIGCNSPGIREVIRDGDNGLLCPVDPERIAAAVERLLGDERLRRRLGEAARRSVSERFSLDKIAELEFCVLSGVMGQGT